MQEANNYYMHAHIHRCMGTKTISITDEAYEILKSRKEKGESFSDVVRRTLGTKITDYAGILPTESAKELKKRTEEGRARSRKRHK